MSANAHHAQSIQSENFSRGACTERRESVHVTLVSYGHICLKTERQLDQLGQTPLTPSSLKFQLSWHDTNLIWLITRFYRARAETDTEVMISSV